MVNVCLLYTSITHTLNRSLYDVDYQRFPPGSQSNKLLPLLQVQKPDQHPDGTGDQEEDATFDDDAFPDDRQGIAGDGERIEEDIPKRTLNKRRIAEDQQGDADDNHQNGSSVTTAGNGGKHEGEVPEKKDREHQLSRHLKKVDRIKPVSYTHLLPVRRSTM